MGERERPQAAGRQSGFSDWGVEASQNKLNVDFKEKNMVIIYHSLPLSLKAVCDLKKRF